MKAMNWERKPLGAVADLCLGKMLDQNKNRGEPLPYLANVNVRWGEFDLSALRTMRFEPKEMDRYGLKFGDIVMCEGGEPGRCAIWKDQIPGMMIQKAIHRIRPKESLDYRFLFYSFLHLGNSKVFDQYFTGATIKHLPGEKLAKVEVDIPPLLIQRRIAGILSAYDDLIENSQRRIKILESMARALYREWFVHFRFPGHESVPRVTGEFGGIPKSWEATTLGEFVSRGSVTLQTGPFGTQLKAEHYTTEGTPVINVRNIGFGSIRADKLEFLPPELVAEHKRHKLQEGDIVFGRKGAVERHLLVSPGEDGWIQGSDCIRLRVESGPLKPRHLSIAFREEDHKRWMMNQCSSGATMASLNQDILCRIPLVIPPPGLIEAFDTFAAVALNQSDTLAAHCQNLRRTRDLLLPRLLSGQVNLVKT